MSASDATMVRTLNERRAIRAVLERIEPETPVVIVGSWARSRHKAPWSDIDLLVISDTTDRLSSPDVQAIVMPELVFKRRLLAGDDFPQWAMRFGVAISGRSSWEQMKQILMDAAPWPDPSRHVSLAKEKLKAGTALLAMGDLSAAQEELRYSASHFARARLLQAGDFPLSRPELVGQLQSIHQKMLATVLGTLSNPDLSRAALAAAAKRLKRYSNTAHSPSPGKVQ